ncbi:Major Facilitator Superfamily protein [Micromonospora pallida]|uniref:Major Facilitator Superfamily protein n=1 Tax=Micromonospora pallida TaxID=145854 RepID=A0A1C6TES5_9ACTN|nr:MFS transporter [Micromonospora pallida]SCL40147.1 Major Facilitator Superfamily protein [Micromonospora pallida]
MNVTRTTAPPVAPDRPATFRDVFAVAEFRVLFASYGVFLIGETVKMLALSVLVYERTGSGLIAALAYVTGFLPHAFGGVFLLALADRWPPRAVIVGYELVRLALVAVLAVGVLSPAGMLGLVFVVGLFGPVSSAARTALLPEILHGDAYVLGRSLLTVASGGTQVVGFAVGGLLLGVVGPYGALWLTAATCALAALLVRTGLRARPGRHRNDPTGPAETHGSGPTRTHETGPTGNHGTGPTGTDGTGPTGTDGSSPTSPRRTGAVRETWRGNRELLADRRIRGLLLAQWLPGSMLVGAEAVAVPYAAELGPGASAGVLLMAGAFGMLLGDLVVGRFVAPAARERLSRWFALLLGVPMLVFPLRPGLVVAALLFAVSAAGFAYQLGLARRFLDALPAARRGQAFGLTGTGMMTAQGLAAAAAGALSEVTGPAAAMTLAGLASLVATGALWRVLTPEPGTDRPARPNPPDLVGDDDRPD